MGCDDDDDAETMEQQEQLPSSTASSQSLPRVQIAFTSAGDESEDVSNLTDVNLKNPDWSGRTQVAALHARANANRLASRLTRSAPGSRRNSVTSLQESPESMSKILSKSSATRPSGLLQAVKSKVQNFLSTNRATVESVSPTWGAPRRTENEDIPMMDLESQIHEERPYSFYESENDSDVEQKPLRRRRDEFHEEASRLIRSFTRQFDHDNPSVERTHRSGTETPAIDQQLHDLDYVPPPKDHKPGITAWLLKLHDVQGAGAAIGRHSFAPDASELGTRKQRPRMRGKSVSSDTMPLSDSHSETPGSSGKVTPLRKQKWYDDKASTRKSPPHSRIQSRTQSTSSLAQLLQSSTSAAIPGLPSALPAQSERPGLPRSRSSGMIATAVERLSHPSHAFKRSSMADEFHITVHIGDILARRQYLITLCRALMMYGAPTHRLEEYLQSSARVLQIDGQFLYIPGCMIMSFDDHVTHTAEVQLVRQKEGVDLGKFQDTFYVYKNTVHDKTNLEDATNELKEIIKRPNKIKTWIRVLLYGVASVSVGPFAFGLRPIDFPIAFLLGCLLGWLQLVVAPRSNQFQHVFEVAAAVLTSFIARALGSIHYNGKELFCFSALAQSSIALILPGYIILCASLELQSRNIVAGSVRMVYAIIYTLFLGFGITIGTALFGFMDPRGATSSVTCESPAYWKNTYLTHFPFVPIFTMCLVSQVLAAPRALLSLHYPPFPPTNNKTPH